MPCDPIDQSKIDLVTGIPIVPPALPFYPGMPMVYLPPSLYEAAKAFGYDMRGFEAQKPIPLDFK